MSFDFFKNFITFVKNSLLLGRGFILFFSHKQKHTRILDSHDLHIHILNFDKLN